jgi:YHS domain-containing protein
VGESEGRSPSGKYEVLPMATDPVCKMQVDEKKAAATSEYNGKTYYFCAQVCKTKFDKNPEQFVSR